MAMTDAEKQAAYRERKRLEGQDTGKPWAGFVGDERENAIRSAYGYAPSETRTQAQRAETAARITSKTRDEVEAAQAVWGMQAGSSPRPRRVAVPKAG